MLAIEDISNKLTFVLESCVRVTCDVGYLCANFSLPRPHCSQVTHDVRDRRQTKASLIMPKNVAASCSKCNKMCLRSGVAPDPTVGAYSAPRPPSWFSQGPLPRRGAERRKVEHKGGKEGKGR